MTIKTLLVALSTSRLVGGEDTRVRFAAGQTVDLTDEELETLDGLEKATGALQYRDPINDVAEDFEIAQTRRFVGEDTAIGSKNVDQLKAFLTYYEVDHAGVTKKDDLKALAEGVDEPAAQAALDAKANGTGNGGDDDQDAWL